MKYAMVVLLLSAVMWGQTQTTAQLPLGCDKPSVRQDTRCSAAITGVELAVPEATISPYKETLTIMAPEGGKIMATISDDGKVTIEPGFTAEQVVARMAQIWRKDSAERMKDYDFCNEHWREAVDIALKYQSAYNQCQAIATKTFSDVKKITEQMKSELKSAK